MKGYQELCGPAVALGTRGQQNVNVIEMWPDHSCNVGIIKEMAVVLKVTTRTQNTKNTQSDKEKDKGGRVGGEVKQLHTEGNVRYE